MYPQHNFVKLHSNC